MSARINHLSITRNKKLILDDVSLDCEPGTITGLIGPSGSGKTTLMRAMLGAQKYQKGSITILDLPAGSSTLRHRIGYVTQSPSVYTDMTVLQNMEYFASIIGASKRQIPTLLERIGLSGQAKQLVSTLSGGQLARTSLGVALLGDPDFLILDEPTVGQDPILREELWKLFSELAGRGKTLVVSSHIMNEASRCDQLAIVRGGRIMKTTTAEALRRETGEENLDDAFLKLIAREGAS